MPHGDMKQPKQIDPQYLKFGQVYFPLCWSKPYEESLFVPELRQAMAVGVRLGALVKGLPHRGWIGV